MRECSWNTSFPEYAHVFFLSLPSITEDKVSVLFWLPRRWHRLTETKLSNECLLERCPELPPAKWLGQWVAGDTPGSLVPSPRSVNIKGQKKSSKQTLEGCLPTSRDETVGGWPNREKKSQWKGCSGDLPFVSPTQFWYTDMHARHMRRHDKIAKSKTEDFPLVILRNPQDTCDNQIFLLLYAYLQMGPLSVCRTPTPPHPQNCSSVFFFSKSCNISLIQPRMTLNFGSGRPGAQIHLLLPNKCWD